MPSRWTELRQRCARRWSELSYGEQRTFRTLAVLVGLAVVAPATYLAIRPGLNRWRHHQALAQADQFEAKADYRNQVLALHRATLIAPGDVETWRRVARTLDRLGASDALVAHENIVNLAPNDARARVALATAALRLGSPEIAREALHELHEEPGEREAYLRLVGELARAEFDWPRYAQSLADLRTLRPDDAEIQLNLALLQLNSSPPLPQQKARDALAELLRVPSVRTRAALALLNFAATSRSSDLAAETARLLIARLSPHPTIIGPTSDLWPALLQSLQQSAATSDPSDVARLAHWMGTIKRAPEALLWLQTLPAPTLANPAVKDVTAELLARTNALPELQQQLADGAWGPMLRESIRLSIEARTEMLADHPTAALARWQGAIREAEQSPETLRQITRLAQIWQSELTIETAAKAALRRQPDSLWAHQLLRDYYLSHGETEKLFAEAASWSAQFSSSAMALWTWVRAGAALDRLDLQMDQATAAALKHENPSPLALMARALFVSRRGQTEEAANLLRSLPSELSTAPELAVCRALVFPHELRPQPSASNPLIFLPEEKRRLNWSE